MFSCVLSCEEDTALSIIDPTSALVELNNARRQKGRKNAGLLDIAEEQLPSLEVSSTTRTGALGRRLSNHNGFWEQKFLKFISKQTNDIQVSTMQPLKTLKPFELT